MNNINKTCWGLRVTACMKVVLLIILGALFFAIWAKILGVFDRVAVIVEPVLENGEYLIYTSADLKIMADLVNGTASRDAKYRLMEDINLDGIDVPWLPIGVNTTVFFNGEFNGDGHTIRNFVINRDSYFVGLFGVVSGDAQISDLKVISFDIRGKSNVGGLVGRNYGQINTSYARGAVSGDANVGGLVGMNSGGKISASYATGVISGYFDIGGLVGGNNGTISTSYASGSVSGDVESGGGFKNDNIGGLVGRNWSGEIGRASCRERV